MATFAPPPLSRYRSPSVASSHIPPRPLDAPDLFPLLNSLKGDPAFQAALAHQQTRDKSKAPSRKPSKRRNASGSASFKGSTSAAGPARRKEERDEWARVPRGGREMRNGDLLAELYGWKPQQVVSRSEVGKQKGVEREKGESAAALFARSTGWEGGGSLPTIRSSQRGSTEAPRRLPHTADLFSMLENPPKPSSAPRDSVNSARTTQASPYPSTAIPSARRPLPPIPARSVPDLATTTTLPPGAGPVETLQAQNSAAYPIHSPLPIAPPLRHSSSFLGASPLGSPPRTGTSFSHAVTQLKRMLSRASNRSMRSRRMSAGAPSTLSRTRTMSSSFTANLVASPAEMSSFQYPANTKIFASPPTSPDSNSTRPDSRPSVTQSSPRPRPRTVFLARDDIDRDLPSAIEARKALLDILREGPPSKSPTNRPPLRSVNSFPLPTPPPAAESASPQPAERLTSMDEPRYWTFDNIAARSASNLPEVVREETERELGFDSAPTPRAIPSTPRGRSESGYYSYGSRWDWDTVGQQEEVEKRSRILQVWKGWVKERKNRAAGGKVVVVD
ncbi:hypothetical protein BCR35DRAFT_353817 [Leucosporidium creatinivorum]|uniref:Uncharacterized protein n=1 Tax=Leucosporidium creatinivorum TaxID=106004 RepID=A0A1Y2ETA6_9BASI|nr:hypothetical protein BCR35DRAFT_353817 [Leucosporidium creatinivorum]